MKINIKNLKGEIFSIDIEPSQTIGNLKQRIATEKGIAAQAQKIIYKGKTTTNQDQIQKLGLKQSDFLVVMAQVAKPQPKAKVEEKVEAPQKKVQAQKPEKKEEKKEQKKDNNSDLASREAQINELISMGFPRQQCINALSAAFNDTGRAVEYLLNGIPADLNSNQLGGPNPLSALMALPQFQQMKALVQADPANLPLVLANIAQTSPEIYNIIAQHPEQFQRLILEGDQMEYDQEEAEQIQGEQEDQGDEGQIVVTQQQEAAITRLSNLGFSKLQAAQAYLACDKNEEMAANLLFDRLANGDIQQQLPGQGGHEEEDDDNLFN